jgi:PAS domain-containing protein
MKSDKRLSLTLSDLEALCGAALCAVDPDGTILAAGPRAENLLGSAPGGLKGAPFPGRAKDGVVLELPGTAPVRVGPCRDNGREILLTVIPPSRTRPRRRRWFGPGRPPRPPKRPRAYF